MEQYRYSRQTILHEFGIDGQKRLSEATVVIIGCGGLGSIVAPFLTGAGIGKLILYDGDSPDLSNLHRQVFFSTDDLKSSKSELLRKHLEKLNPETEVIAHGIHIDKNNIAEILNQGDIVVECSDDIQCKYLVNDFCHLNKIPMVYGSIYKYEGYVSFFRNSSENDIHLRDSFPRIPENLPSCSEVGVMNTVAGIIGLMQANEVIKYFIGSGSLIEGELLIYNVLQNEQVKLKLKKSWKEDISSVFNNTSYKGNFCNPDFEIDINNLRRNKDHFKIISILEKNEHEKLFDDVIHEPYSTIDIDHWINQDSPVVFYCSLGQRSGILVTELRKANPEGKFYSLKNGIMNL